MTNKSKQQNTVPFDPGFAPYVLVFSTTYEYMRADIKKFKNANQRKMKYKVFEPGLLKLCDNLIAFYLGCILYGAYLKNKYIDEPKEIEGNDFLGLNEEDCKNGDVVIEVDSLANFIKSNENNPFATRKINPKYETIIDSYKEFLEINNFFTNVKTTADLKIPKKFEYINKYSAKSVDKILDAIKDSINCKKIETLLNSEYFDKV